MDFSTWNWDNFWMVAPSVFSAIATGLAAYATWRAPISAATKAEQLRREGERTQERQKNKLHLFASLMQERAAIYSETGVRALNLIDVVFHDSRNVREAWADLYLSFDTKNNIPHHVQDERLRRLLAEMANDIGLGDGLRIDDFGRVYFPNALAQDQLIRDMQRQQLMNNLQGQKSSPSANSAAPQIGMWPPPPKPSE